MWDVDWRLLRVIARRLAIATESSCGGRRDRFCAGARRGVDAERKRRSPPAESDQDASEASSSSEVVSSTAAGEGRERVLGLMNRSEAAGLGDCFRRFPEAIQDIQDLLFCGSSIGS